MRFELSVAIKLSLTFDETLDKWVLTWFVLFYWFCLKSLCRFLVQNLLFNNIHCKKKILKVTKPYRVNNNDKMGLEILRQKLWKILSRTSANLLCHFIHCRWNQTVVIFLIATCIIISFCPNKNIRVWARYTLFIKLCAVLSAHISGVSVNYGACDAFVLMYLSTRLKSSTG